MKTSKKNVKVAINHRSKLSFKKIQSKAVQLTLVHKDKKHKHHVILLYGLFLFFIVALAIIGYKLTEHSVHPKNSKSIVSLIHKSSPNDAKVSSYGPISIDRSSFISMFNQVRTQNGLSALTENSELDQAAQNRAQDMVGNNYFNNSSDNPQQFITNTGYKPDLWLLQSMKDPASLTGAINSFRQDTNPSPFILNSSVTEIGVGQATGQQNNQAVEYVVVYLAKPYWCGYAGISCAQYCNMAQTSQQQSIKSEQSMLNLSLSYANSSYLTTSQRDSEIQQDYANYNTQVKADYNAYLEQVNAVPGCTVIYQPLYQNPPSN